MNFNKKILSLLSIIVLLLCISPRVNAYNNNYYIKHYNVDIEVRENNSYLITETIDAYFDAGANKHGIIRNIPLKNNIYREDGSTGVTKANISNINVEGADFLTSEEGNNLSIRIGSRDIVVEGDVTYKISYIYSIGRDILKDKDEFYFNIIGDEWDTDINSVDFTVKFPKEFDYSKLGFSKGIRSSDYTGIYWRVEKDVVYGYYHEVLPPYSALTMRLELPEGYFYYEPNFLDKFGTLLMYIPLALLGFIYFLYRKYAKNEDPVEVIDFYPPDDLNPLEIGYYFDAVLDNKDVTSLLIYLANQGYLRIEDTGRDKYNIVLLKEEYEGDDEQERTFFNGLKSRANSEGLITEKKLNNSFYTVVEKIKKHYDTRKRKKEIVIPTGKYQALAIISGIFMMLLSIFFLVYYKTYDSKEALFIALGVSLVTAFYAPFVFTSVYANWFGKIIIWGILLIHFIVIGLMTKDLIIDTLLMNDKYHAILGLIGFIAGIITIFISFKMFKRTDYGNIMYGKIKGFRNFLEDAEKEKLEMLVEEDPSYFYNILPYAHVLGVSSKWIKKFDDIAMPPPSWYSGKDYNHRHFNKRLDDSIDNLTHNMTTSPSSSYSSSGSSGGFSSSSSSGGGFSGGGSGGGGGSSW